jgi:hypothetical protein
MPVKAADLGWKFRMCSEVIICFFGSDRKQAVKDLFQILEKKESRQIKKESKNIIIIFFLIQPYKRVNRFQESQK